MKDYLAGIRHSGIMQHAASILPATEIAAVAAHYGRKAASPSPAGAVSPASEAADPGESIALGALQDPDAPACAACHGPWPHPLPANNPPLGGQHEEYLFQQMKAWPADTRGGADRVSRMHAGLKMLDEAELRAVASYYARMPAN